MKFGKSIVFGIVDWLVKVGFLKCIRNESNCCVFSLELIEKGVIKVVEMYYVFFNCLEFILEIGEERLKEMLEMY